MPHSTPFTALEVNTISFSNQGGGARGGNKICQTQLVEFIEFYVFFWFYFFKEIDLRGLRTFLPVKWVRVAVDGGDGTQCLG